jgi:bifunctional non-homologous end joining protein LigD
MSRNVAVELEGVRLTSPDKVLYPEQGISKRALAEYYVAVADRALPHLARRPLSLVRCPAGSSEACFFQKHVGSGVPGEVRRVEIPDGVGTAEHSAGRSTYLWVEDARGLVALAQMGVLEIHPWGSTIDRLETPDRLVFDLDPAPGFGWEGVVEATRAVRDRLAALGLDSFLKTTGGKGLHVVVPIAPEHDWGVVKPFARAVAAAMAEAEPGRFTINMAKKARTGRIFLDYLRNGRGATAVAPYSSRARPGATVSMPIAWRDLSPRLDPRDFTILTVPKLLARRRQDPWAGIGAARQALGPALAKLGL